MLDTGSGAQRIEGEALQLPGEDADSLTWARSWRRRTLQLQLFVVVQAMPNARSISKTPVVSRT